MGSELYKIIWAHFVGDFICQTDAMAINKSKSCEWLGLHVATYGIPFWFFFSPRYVLLNICLHFVVDFFTSRLTSYLWKREMRHWFFVVIGFDQAVHFTLLLLTFGL